MSRAPKVQIRIALTIFGFCLANNDVMGQSATDVHSRTKPQIGTVERSIGSRSDADKKISSAILDELSQSTNGYVVAGVPHLAPSGQAEPSRLWEVDITGRVSPDLLSAITSEGGVIETSSVKYGAIRAKIPSDKIKAIAGRPEVTFIERKQPLTTNNISVASEGGIAHMVDVARRNYSVRGAGVRIGIISDSVNSTSSGLLQKAYQSKALDPNKTTIIQDGISFSDSDEGLPMMEIIHAIAPEAQLLFETADGGDHMMAESIDDLRRKGCQIIVDDVTYQFEPPFQDGRIALAVKDASDAGVLYFSSARNAGNAFSNTSSTWEGDFRDGGLADSRYRTPDTAARVHVFTGRITLNTIDHAKGSTSATLFWSDPLRHSSNDYDLFEVDNRGDVVQAGTSAHDGTQDPYQYITQIRQGDSLIIVKHANASPRFLHLEVANGELRADPKTC